MYTYTSNILSLQNKVVFLTALCMVTLVSVSAFHRKLVYHLNTMSKGTRFTTQMIQSESTVLTDNNTFDVYALSLVGRYPHCL